MLRAPELHHLLQPDTPMATRKRRRSQAFPDHNNIEEELPITGVNNEDGNAHEHVDDDPAAQEWTDKEQEIWDSFREEHFEVLEQLPLSLHRSFSLMLEMDQQVHAHEAQILPTLRHYIRLRRTLAGIHDESETVDEPRAIPQNDGAKPIGTDAHEPQPETQMSPSRMTRSRSLHSDETRSLRSVSGSSPSKTKGPTASSPAKSTSHTVPTFIPQPPSTRALLTQVAQLSEEVVRAANEKVNVARFAYDLVDRYIRDLDRAIKEQETSISLGLRPGTHPASIILPEVIVPKPIRAPRLAQSPSPDLDAPQGLDEAAVAAAAAAAEPEGPTLGVVSSEQPPRGEGAPRVAPRRKKSAKWSRKKAPKAAAGVENAPEHATAQEPVSPRKVRSVRLTMASAAPNVPDGSEIPVDPDPNEQRYCFCDRVSYGEMVACDNPNCEREWFHLPCVDLTILPGEDDKWYCRECAPNIGRTTRRKARS
ncbi:hypothetical protein B0H21DRAFT_719130 [Amylocystis lapponica]|nr:hypothetical protein B0H21DRAFT_719130 [Amylocystis lapponica]